MQDICTSATYLAIFNNMDTVVFFNGMGREVQLWKDLVGAFLPARNIEGQLCPAALLKAWSQANPGLRRFTRAGKVAAMLIVTDIALGQVGLASAQNPLKSPHCRWALCRVQGGHTGGFA